MANHRLGELLVREKLISLAQLRQAQEEQQRSGQNLGYTLAKLGYISDNEITNFLSTQYRVPAVNLDEYEIDGEVLKLVSKDVCEKHKVLPVARAGSSLIVAMSDPPFLIALAIVSARLSGARATYWVQDLFPQIAAKLGLADEDMPHQRSKTLCCGEGGAVGCLSPELARNWGRIRKEETAGRRMVTYCGGCAGFLGALTPTSHILDLVFEPEATISGKVKVSRAPFTYWNRIRLKARFKKMLATAPITRERTFTAHPPAGMTSLILRILVLLLIVGGVFSVIFTLAGWTRKRKA